VSGNCAVVAVIGAGPAGAIAAIRLARAGLDVRLIDRGRLGNRMIAETLSPEGKGTLAHAGLWNELPNDSALPCPPVVNSWERAEPTSRSFISNPYGTAWHVDRTKFDPWLASEATAAGANMLRGALTHVRRHEESWALNVRGPAGQMTLRDVDFLVVATGRPRSVTTLGQWQRNDTLTLIGSLSEPNRYASNALLVEAVPTGWWYSAPTIDGRMFTGLVTDRSIWPTRHYQDAMATALDDAPLTRARLAKIGDGFCAGIVLSALRPCAGDQWVVVGDAALARDPLSGDGLAAALRSGWDGAGTILDALKGDEAAWRQAAHRTNESVHQYMRQRSAAYRLVHRRWPREAFWSARGGTE
jgi:flavin-dependent dehydrogenase